MIVTVHTFSGSPFGWRVQLALEHVGVHYDIRLVSPSKGEHRSEVFLAMNPRGKVPVFVDDDVTLYESSAIVEYIADRFRDGAKLFPNDVFERARIRRLICEIDRYWWPAAWQIARNVYFKGKKDWDLEQIDEGRKELLGELMYLEGEMRGDCLGPELGAADYTLYPLLAHIARYEIRKPDLGLAEAIGPRLRGLMTRIEALPHYERTYPPHWRES